MRLSTGESSAACGLRRRHRLVLQQVARGLRGQQRPELPRLVVGPPPQLLFRKLLLEIQDASPVVGSPPGSWACRDVLGTRVLRESSRGVKAEIRIAARHVPKNAGETDRT